MADKVTRDKLIDGYVSLCEAAYSNLGNCPEEYRTALKTVVGEKFEKDKVKAQLQSGQGLLTLPNLKSVFSNEKIAKALLGEELYNNNPNVKAIINTPLTKESVSGLTDAEAQAAGSDGKGATGWDAFANAVGGGLGTNPADAAKTAANVKHFGAAAAGLGGGLLGLVRGALGMANENNQTGNDRLIAGLIAALGLYMGKGWMGKIFMAVAGFVLTSLVLGGTSQEQGKTTSPETPENPAQWGARGEGPHPVQNYNGGNVTPPQVRGNGGRIRQDHTPPPQ